MSDDGQRAFDRAVAVERASIRLHESTAERHDALAEQTSSTDLGGCGTGASRRRRARCAERARERLDATGSARSLAAGRYRACARTDGDTWPLGKPAK